MRGRRRIASWIAGALLAAGICGAIALHLLVDPEHLKRVAQDKARQAWSRELSIGDMSLSFFPLPALSATDLALANPPWARNRALVRVQEARARLALLPLLVGKVRLVTFELDGVRASLEVGPDGRGSWEMVSGSAPAGARSNESEEGYFALEAIHISNADIVYIAKNAAPVPWRVVEAEARSGGGLRDVRIEASLSRRQRPLTLKASIDDLSRAGRPGATTGARIDLDWGKTRLAMAGTLPLESAMKGAVLTADLASVSLDDMLAFFDVNHGRTAAAKARVEMQESKGGVQVTRLAASLGKFSITGEGRVARTGAKTRIDGRIEGNRLEWERFLLDLGFPEVPGLEPDELFRDVPLAWPFLVSLQAQQVQGALDVKLQGIVLRNHVELTGFTSSALIDGDRLDLKPFSTHALGGSISGTLSFEGRKKLVHASLDGEGLLLERWFRERGATIPFRGGPMKVKAVFTATGNSMKGLAATVTGPVTIRMGPGVWASEKAGHAETVMTAFGGKDAASIDFECVGASLPFTNGRAASKSIVGARSAASQLLTSGFVDLREETLDLRGRVQPKAGKVGLATVAGDIRIHGKIRNPEASLDPVGAPEAIARGAAAIATAGLSLVGTAMANAEHARTSDACEAVFTMP
ncbi:MAG: AsmA family protein [Usitatibacter sp.]